MISEKINLTISKSKLSKLKNEQNFFGLQKNTYYNKILTYYRNNDIKIYEIDTEKNKENDTESIKLNIKNFKNIETKKEKEEIENPTKYIRGIMCEYLNNSPIEKERILFDENIKELEKCIELKEKIRIEYFLEKLQIVLDGTGKEKQVKAKNSNNYDIYPLFIK